MTATDSKLRSSHVLLGGEKGSIFMKEDREDAKKYLCEVYKTNGCLVGASETGRLLVLIQTLTKPSGSSSNQ